jgi:cobalt-zinc-cadmium efflux system membrane fusion protein
VKIVPLASLALVLGSASCHREEAADPVPPDGEAWVKLSQFEGAGMDTSRADLGEVGGAVSAWGRLTFDETRVSHVFSPVSGRVVKLLASQGTRVHAGQPLATIESQDLDQALSDERKAQATFDAVELDLERQKDLSSQGAGSVHDLEQATAVEGNARAELDRARQRTHLLSATSGPMGQPYLLRSPIDGVVLACMVNPGTELSGQYGSGGGPELFTVGDPRGMVLAVDVPETEMGRLRSGEEVEADFSATPEDSVTGIVTWVSPVLDTLTRSVRVRCQLDSIPRNLRPEQEAQASIAVPGRVVLSVPRTAVVRMGGQTFVWTLDGRTSDGSLRFLRHVVEVDDDAQGPLVEIRGGILRGAEVVSRGAILVGA